MIKVSPHHTKDPSENEALDLLTDIRDHLVRRETRSSELYSAGVIDHLKSVSETFCKLIISADSNNGSLTAVATNRAEDALYDLDKIIQRLETTSRPPSLRKKMPSSREVRGLVSDLEERREVHAHLKSRERWLKQYRKNG